jgi:hypothetical protein
MPLNETPASRKLYNIDPGRVFVGPDRRQLAASRRHRNGHRVPQELRRGRPQRQRPPGATG